MSTTTPLNTFTTKSNHIHDHKYNYDRVVYINRYTEVEIVCPVHGSFFQKPIYHTQRKSGCPDCYRESQKYNEESFRYKATQAFGNKYICGIYNGFRLPIKITCTVHNHIFTTTPSNHVRKGGNGGCPLCKQDLPRVPTSTWIDRFIKRHGNLYDYTNLPEIIRSGQKISVLCPSHGVFTPTPDNHARGHGCPVCACMDKYVGGYSEGFFMKNPHKRDAPGIFYVVKFTSDVESFIKVGITNRTINIRFASMSYTKEILLEHYTTLYEAHILEDWALQTFQSFRYIPIHTFGGWTECLNTNVEYNLLSKLPI